MAPMTDLERFVACMEYQPMDYTPFWNWGAWPETYERWKKTRMANVVRVCWNWAALAS